MSIDWRLKQIQSWIHKDFNYIENYTQVNNMLRLRKGEEHLFMMITYCK